MLEGHLEGPAREGDVTARQGGPEVATPRSGRSYRRARVRCGWGRREAPGARTPSGVGLGWPSQVPDARRGSSSAASTLPSCTPQLLPGQVGRLALESAKLAPKKFVHDVS